jgi:hypothetical protein
MAVEQTQSVVTAANGKVVIAHDRPVSVMMLEPARARLIAQAILANADVAESQSS